MQEINKGKVQLCFYLNCVFTKIERIIYGEKVLSRILKSVKISL